MQKDVSGSYIWGHHQPTKSEKRLAEGLRRAGIKYGREVDVKGFTVDFMIDGWLVVEVDGESHLTKDRAKRDASRQRILENSGCTVLRVPASELLAPGGLGRWVKKIKEAMASPGSKLQRFRNVAYRNQLEKVRKALLAGEAERERRENLAYGNPKGRQRGSPKKARDSAEEETMEDYFGEGSVSFASLLEKYDGSPVKQTGKRYGAVPRPRRRK